MRRPAGEQGPRVHIKLLCAAEMRGKMTSLLVACLLAGNLTWTSNALSAGTSHMAWPACEAANTSLGASPASGPTGTRSLSELSAQPPATLLSFGCTSDPASGSEGCTAASRDLSVPWSADGTSWGDSMAARGWSHQW